MTFKLKTYDKGHQKQETEKMFVISLVSREFKFKIH